MVIQSGMHSTETLNIAVTDTLLEAIDKTQLSIIIFFALSKAFDRIQHDTLLNKMMGLGLITELLIGSKATCPTDHNIFVFVLQHRRVLL